MEEQRRPWQQGFALYLLDLMEEALSEFQPASAAYLELSLPKDEYPDTEATADQRPTISLNQDLSPGP